MPPSDRVGERHLADLLNALAHELRGVLGTMNHQIDILAAEGLDDSLRERGIAALATDSTELDRLLTAISELAHLWQRTELPGFITFAAAELVPSEALGGEDRSTGRGSPMVQGDRDLLLRSTAMVRHHLAGRLGVGVSLVLADGPTGDEAGVVVRLEADAAAIDRASTDRDQERGQRRPVTLADGVEPFVAAELARAGGATLTLADRPGGLTAYELGMPAVSRGSGSTLT